MESSEPEKAQFTLAKLGKKTLSLLDQQLIKVESLRQRATPKMIKQLAEIEAQLSGLQLTHDAAELPISTSDIHKNIEIQLQAIENTL